MSAIYARHALHALSSTWSTRTKEMLRQRQQTLILWLWLQATQWLENRKACDATTWTKDSSWKPAIVSPTKEPRLYLVQTTDGGRYRRNRRFLRRMSNQLFDKIDVQQTPEPDSTRSCTALHTPERRHSATDHIQEVHHNSGPGGQHSITTKEI